MSDVPSEEPAVQGEDPAAEEDLMEEPAEDEAEEGLESEEEQEEEEGETQTSTEAPAPPT